MEYAERLGIPREQIHFYDGHTAYVDAWDTLVVGTDVMPAARLLGRGTLTANQRLGWKEAIGYEVTGHRGSNLAGKAHPAGSALDEAQASIRAARFAENLTKTQRMTLLRDGVARLHKEGLRLRDVRDKLWIEDK